MEITAEETPEARAPVRLEDSCEVAAAAAARDAVDASADTASAPEGGLGAGPSEEPECGVSRAMIQPEVPPEFARNEQWEYDVWEAHYEVGDQIETALNHALELHRGRNLQISDVSDYPATCPFLIAFMWSSLMSFCLQQLMQMSRDKCDELA